MTDKTVLEKDSMARKLASAERDRALDKGHFNQYGMRDDPRGKDTVDGENPGDGENARHFGADGDASSYGNRPGHSGQPPQN